MTDPAIFGFRQALRRIGTVGITLAFFGAAGSAVVGGLSVIPAQTDAATGTVAPLVPVGVTVVEFAQGYTVTRRFIGQIEAAARADLGFEPGGRITQLIAEEGDLVAAGTVLARLDTSALIPERAALEAELAALAADAELARLTLQRNDTLADKGFRPAASQDDARLALARSEAGMAAVRARIAGVDVQLEKSVLRAPFAARIGARLADPGQTVASGQTVLVLFDASPARARVGLPPDLAAPLQPGDSVMIEVGTTRQAAKVRHIRPDLDASTRSRSVILTLPAGSGEVLGDTVALVLNQRIEALGFWVPLSSLREGVRGSWAVMAVETTPEGDRTLPAAVEVIHSDGARVFVQGVLPPGARIIAIAPDRVTPGQLVLAELATAGRE